MKIIRYEAIQNNEIYNRARIVREISFNNYDDRLKVIEASKHSQETIEKWFDVIGIKFDSLRVTKNNILYSINGEELTMAELSHGERYLLFLIACKVTNEFVIAESLLEILGYRLRNVLYEQLSDYEQLIIVTFNAYPTEYLIKYKVERI